MSKWRNNCPDKLLTRIANIAEARLYLLRQTGPTGFLLKEHNSETKFKVKINSNDISQCLHCGNHLTEVHYNSIVRFLCDDKQH